MSNYVEDLESMLDARNRRIRELEKEIEHLREVNDSLVKEMSLFDFEARMTPLRVDGGA